MSFSLLWCSDIKKIVYKNLYIDPPIVLKYWINPNILFEVSLICLTRTFRVTWPQKLNKTKTEIPLILSLEHWVPDNGPPY